MTCLNCGHEPPAGSTFCNGCGAKLALTCASCGAAPPPGSRFCNECGATLGADPKASVASSSPEPQPRPVPSDARKVVTILFADLAGSTALHERLDPESVRSFMESYYRAMRAAIAAHGGTLVKLLGDGVMAAFGVPHVAEDDALRAVRAGVEMQEAFRTLAREHVDVDLRVAINTGEVVVGADNTDVVGDPVNVAARLQQEAHGGDVVIGETTRRLVAARVTLEPLGTFTLRGRAEQVKAWRVTSLERPTGAAAVAFVGRVEELGRIDAVYEDAVTRRAARLAVLLGSPGLGKSRLIDEMAGRLGETTTVLSAHCDAAGGTTFAPIAAAVRKLLDAERSTVEAVIPDSDTERTRIAAGMTALLAGAPASPEETFFVIRRFLTGLAQAKPVVLVIDDLQWAEPLLLDLVEHLVQWGSGVPLLVLVAARPELRDVRSSLVTRGGLVADVVTLGGLDAGAATRLAANVIGASDLPAAVAAKVLATSEGNPLFVGELVRMLVDQGAIERQGDRWIIGANLAALEMPPTIHALLAARIERLRSEERAVLEHASVVGRHFSRSAVAALLGRNGIDVDARLEALRRTELIEADTGWFLGEPVLRFHHVLIRDAAYRRLLKGTRATLHAQLADWIETKVGDDAEHDEIIGRHLEQAHQLLRELGAVDDRGRELGARAAVRLAAAGRRALAGDDVPLAANLLGRAIERLENDDPTRAELALDWCEALLSTGDVAEAKTALAELRNFLSRASADAAPPDGPKTADVTTADALNTLKRLAAWHTCFTGQLTVLTAPQGLRAAAESVAAAAQELAALGDSAGEAKAHFVQALALARLGEVGGCEAALDRALAAARGAGDRRRANTVLAIAPIAALWGPSPVTRASGRCLDVVRVLRITQGAPAVEAVALSCQGVLEALRGRTEAARRMIASARHMVEELGITERLLEADASAGLVALLEGDAPAAERDLRGAYEGLRDLGLGIDAARASALLARALLAQGRDADAETLSHECEQLAGDDLKAAIAWRGVRAEALARRGEHAAAIELASEAVELAAATDALLDHADARVAFAVALRAAGRIGEADAESRRALELWVTKGATLLVDRAGPADVRSAPPETAPRDATLRRRVRPNAATAITARFEAAVAAGEESVLETLLDDALNVVDHQNAATYGRAGQLASLERLLRMRNAALAVEPLATLGESLLLWRRRIRAAGTAGGRFDVGDIEREEIVIFEVAGASRISRIEIFAANRLGDAIARLYDRHAELLPDGPLRQGAAVTARAVAFMLMPGKAADLTALYAPTYEDVDHRSVGYGALSRDEADKLAGSFEDVAEGVRFRVDEVLALSPSGFVRKTTTTGVWRDGGGSFERAVCTFSVFGTDGRVTRHETFEADRQAEALSRFDEVASGTVPRVARRRVRPNLATRHSERFAAAVAVRDVAAIASLVGESLRCVHHPTGVTWGRAEALETTHSAFTAERLEFRREPLATLGDTLSLERHVTVIEGLTEDYLAGLGLAEIAEVSVVETNERGQSVWVEIFAPDRIGDAIACLYRRYAESLRDGPERTRASTIARKVQLGGPVDVERMATANAPWCGCVDHRVLGSWSARDRDEQARHWRSLVDLAPDLASRCEDVLALEPDALLVRSTFFGTSRESGGTFENRVCVLLEFGLDGLITHVEVFEAEHETEALARFDVLTGGEDTAVTSAPSANAASNAFRAFERCWRARDWTGVVATYHPAHRMDDRRRLMRIEVTGDAFFANERVLFDDTASEWRGELLAARGDRLALFRVHFTATVADSGPMEVEALDVVEVDADGLRTSLVVFDPEDVAAAHAELDARFAELAAAIAPAAPSERRDARAAVVKPTLATVSMERAWAALDVIGMNASEQALDVLRARTAPEFVWEDRRRVVGLSGDLNLMVASMRERVASGARHENRTIGTAGNQVLIERVLWVGGPAGARFEVEYLAVHEVTEAGLVTASIFFDADDLRTAQHEAWRRWAAIEPASAALTGLLGEGRDAFNAHDRTRFRALLADDLVVEDRRLTGAGHIEGADAYVESLDVYWDLAPDQHAEVGLVWHAYARHGGVTVFRQWGTLRDGGAFESEYLMLLTTAGGRVTRFEYFELEDLDAVLARFEELRPDPLRIPPNAATRAHGRWSEICERRDWRALPAIYADDVVLDDRRPLTRNTTAGRDTLMKNARYLWETSGGRVRRTTLAVAGDRFALECHQWCAREDVPVFEVDVLELTEVDEHGCVRRITLFDPSDRATANTEMLASYVRVEGGNESMMQVLYAWNTHDAARLLELLPADFYIDDRRRTGVGLLRGAKAWVQSLVTVWELNPDIRLEALYTIGEDTNAVLYVCRWAGRYAEGSEFETVAVTINVQHDDMLAGLEIFELEDMEIARARFESLTNGTPS